MVEYRIRLQKKENRIARSSGSSLSRGLELCNLKL